MKLSIALLFFALATVGFGQSAPASPPSFRNLNAAQQGAFEGTTGDLATAVAVARTALTNASFSGSSTAADRAQEAQAVGDAELALARARADALAGLQTSGNRLNSSQVAGLVQSAARGGRGAAATTVPKPAGRVAAGDSRIRYMGRWDKKPDAATTVNSGTSILFRFNGTSIKGLFQTVTAPSQIYAAIDHGAKALYAVDKPEIDFAAAGLSPGDHVIEIETKDVSQNMNRWNPPLAAALIFIGFDVGAGQPLPIEPAMTGRWNPNALRIEFYGDSITQGVRAISMATDPSGSDGTRTYSYLTGLAFQANVTEVGFGAQAITHGGGGAIPIAAESFYFNFAGSLVDPLHPEPDVVVINQGTNDGGASPVVFEPAYLGYLTRIRRAYPHAFIAAMRPFNGTQDASIYAAVQAMKDPRVIYIDTDGWLELTNSPDYTEQPTGLHPTLSGHAKAAKLLTDALRRAGVRETGR